MKIAESLADPALYPNLFEEFSLYASEDIDDMLDTEENTNAEIRSETNDLLKYEVSLIERRVFVKSDGTKNNTAEYDDQTHHQSNEKEARPVTTCKQTIAVNEKGVAKGSHIFDTQIRTEENMMFEAQQLAEKKAILEAQQLAAEKAMLEAQQLAEEKAILEAQQLAAGKAILEARQLAAEKAILEAQQLAEEKAILKAQQLAEEKANLEAKQLAEAKAILEAKQLAEEKAMLEAQQLAEEKAILEAQQLAEEKAILEAQQLAEEKAILEAQQLAEAKAILEAQQLAEEKAILEAQQLAEEKVMLKAQQLAEEKAALETQQVAENEINIVVKSEQQIPIIKKKESGFFSKLQKKVKIEEERFAQLKTTEETIAAVCPINGTAVIVADVGSPKQKFITNSEQQATFTNDFVGISVTLQSPVRNIAVEKPEEGVVRLEEDWGDDWVSEEVNVPLPNVSLPYTKMERSEGATPDRKQRPIENEGEETNWGSGDEDW